MIDSIELKNMYNNIAVTLSKSVDNAFLLDDDGIQWGSIPANHSTYNNLTGFGDIVTYTKLNSRDITITGKICSPHTNREISRIYDVSSVSAIKAHKLQEIEDAKKKLSQIINPLNDVRIIHDVFFIEGKPTSSIEFSHRMNENNEVYCKYTFTLRCSDPLFHYNSTIDTPLSGVYGGFHFPVILSESEKLHYGVLYSYQLVNVTNSGDTELGGVITIKTTGEVVNPVITNVLKQERIKINKTLSAGEIVVIDTINRKVIGSIDDGLTYSNYLQYWDFENTWFQFAIGDTLFGFSADGETYTLMDVLIELNWSFYSMEDQ